MKGSIDRPSGVKGWRLRMYVNGKQESSFFDTREEAERARKAQNMVLAETASDYEGTTVAKFGHKVLTRREVKKKVRDPESDWSRFHEHIERDMVGRMAVRAVRGKHIFGWCSRMEDKGLAPSTRRNSLSLLRAIFREAHRVGLTASNPVLGVRIEGKDKDAWTYLTREEMPRTLEAFRSLDRYMAGVAIGTGLRPGELAALRLSDVHLDDRPRIVVRYGSPPDLPTKTGAVRTVPLFGLSLTAMRAWLEVLPELGWPNPLGLVFPRDRGGFRDKDHLIRWEEWKAVLKRAGITRRFRWYDFRHTCASWLVSGWWGPRWSLQEVKEMLGHSSITITQRYAHLAASSIEERAKGTGLQVSVSQLQGEQSGPDLATEVCDKIPLLLAAPPAGIEPAASGLGIHGLSQDKAEIRAADSLLTQDGRHADFQSAGRLAFYYELPLGSAKPVESVRNEGADPGSKGGLKQPSGSRAIGAPVQPERGGPTSHWLGRCGPFVDGLLAAGGER